MRNLKLGLVVYLGEAIQLINQSINSMYRPHLQTHLKSYNNNKANIINYLIIYFQNTTPHY